MAGIVFTEIEDSEQPRVNAVAMQGSTWEYVLKVVHEDTGLPFNLSGYSGRSQIRKGYGSIEVVKEWVVTILAPPENGEIRLRLEAVDTAGIKRGRYVSDVEIYTAGDGEVKKVLQIPKLEVYPEVTKPIV